MDDGDDVASGTYIGAVTGIVNLDTSGNPAASRMLQGLWTSVRSAESGIEAIVSVTAAIQLDPVTSGVATLASVELPIASDLTDSRDLLGTMVRA